MWTENGLMSITTITELIYSFDCDFSIKNVIVILNLNSP